MPPIYGATSPWISTVFNTINLNPAEFVADEDINRPERK
jgi:hypothetical protein